MRQSVAATLVAGVFLMGTAAPPKPPSEADPYTYMEEAEGAQRLMD